MAYLDVILLMVVCGLLFIPFLVLFIFVMRKKSFKNTAWIARQTGRDINDVIWIRDNFKVNYKDGVWEIQFMKIKEHTPSIDGSFWTKLLEPKNKNNEIISFSREEWDKLDLSRHIKRGVFFYENTEGEFYPMIIQGDGKDNNFSIVNQDNRSFIMHETQNINSLTKNKSAEVILLVAIVIGIIGIVVVSALVMYFQNKQHDSNVQETARVCGQYSTDIVNALTNPTNNGTRQAQFVNTLKIPGG